MQKNYHSRTGHVLIEVVIAAGFVVIIVAIFVHLTIGSFGLERRARENTIATNIAQEGLEATRSIANRNFAELTPGSHGLDATSGVYYFAGASNSIGPYTRVITVDSAQRNGNGDLVLSGGTDDPNTRQLTSTVTWNPVQGGTSNVKLITYFVHWKSQKWISNLKTTFQSYFRNSTEISSSQNGEVNLEYPNPGAPIETLTLDKTLNLTGTADVTEVIVDEIRDRLYISLKDNGANHEFFSYDISDISRGNMSQSGSLELGEGSRGFALGKNYAYVLTDGPTQEIRVVRLSDFLIVATWDIPGALSNDPYDVLLDEAANRLYVGRGLGGDENEFYILNTSNPLGPISIVGSTTIGAQVNAVAIRQNYAYIATGQIDGEIFMVNLTSMFTQRCDLPGVNQAAVALFIEGDHLYIGREAGAENEFSEYAINPNSPQSCPALNDLVGSVNLSDSVFAMSVQPHRGLAFFVMNNGSKEIRVVSLQSFTEVEDLNLTGDKCDAITFFGSYVFAGCRDDTSTIQAVKLTSSRAQEGTMTSLPFDGGTEPISWKKLSWTMSGPGWVTMRIRTANSLQNLKQAQWVGPDGTSNTVFSGGVGNTILTDPSATGTRYIQWKAMLGSDNGTPTLTSVSLTYQ